MLFEYAGLPAPNGFCCWCHGDRFAHLLSSPHLVIKPVLHLFLVTVHIIVLTVVVAGLAHYVFDRRWVYHYLVIYKC